MKKYLVTAATVITVGLISGCSGTGTQTTSIGGKVADGYLVNAFVYMDKNGNYQFDAGEPSATTDAQGAYVLKVDPADVGKYPLVALAVAGQTIDMDNPGQPVARSYLLSLPKSSVSGAVSSNFISPLSSQLREMMETGKYASVDQAREALRTRLGLPAGTNLLGDYLLMGHAGMHTAAQRIASLMGIQMPQIMETIDTTTPIQVDRYRGMMGMIFSNMSSIKAAPSPMDNAGLTNRITDMLTNMPLASPGKPFRNMSSAFRGGILTTGVTLYKHFGSVQCQPIMEQPAASMMTMGNLGGGTSLPVMQQQLTDAGIQVLFVTCGHDGFLRPAMCGVEDGRIAIFEVPAAQAEAAVALGFAPLSDLPDATRFSCGMR
jgi:hypothetical protein